MKKKKSLTKEEVQQIAQYQWANVKDIMDIGAIGRNKAREVHNILSDKFYNGKPKVQNGLVPMDMVLEYFNVSLNHKEEQLNG